MMLFCVTLGVEGVVRRYVLLFEVYADVVVDGEGMGSLVLV